MALPSQTERSSSSSRVLASRSRGNGARKVLLAAAVVILAGGAIALLYVMNRTVAGPAVSGAQPVVGGKAPPLESNEVGSRPPRRGERAETDSAAKTPEDPGHSRSSAADSAGGLNRPITPRGIDEAPSVAAESSSESGLPIGESDPSTDSTKPRPIDLSNPAAVSPGAQEATADSRPQAPSEAIAPSGSTQEVRTIISRADEAARQGSRVQARQLYSRALMHPAVSKADQDSLRQILSELNAELVFSPRVTPGDPLAEVYTIKAGDVIARLPRARELLTDWRLIQRINAISDADLSRLKIGQKVKLVRGPFHAVVTKSEYRLDLFAGSPDERESWLYIRSFRVGLGAENGTPVGTFVVRNRQINPPWTNPRTGEKFAADDPKNPIGERWIGWEGVGPSAGLKGFGIHGTIEPSSVGRQESMGCVRMLDEDVALVYEMLIERVSVVQVRP